MNTNDERLHGGILCTVTDSEQDIRVRRSLSAYWPETVDRELKCYHPIPLLSDWMVAVDFSDVYTEQVESAYRRRTYSALQELPDEVWPAGLVRLEADLVRGPVICVSRYTLVWGHKVQPIPAFTFAARLQRCAPVCPHALRALPTAAGRSPPGPSSATQS